MTAIDWLIILAVAVGAVWAAVGAADAAAARRELPPVPQPARYTPPPLPLPSRLRVDMDQVRAGRPGNGRHRRPGGAL
jgi:hypothetical protein